MILGRLPTVPEYYSEFINSEVDLVLEPKQCCPFHSEKTPSFSYNIATGRWSCFGKCHAHGDVVEMHKRYFHFNSIEEARDDLNAKCMVPKENLITKIQRGKNELYIDESKIEEEVLYSEALVLAGKDTKRWLELDYVMSQSPINRADLIDLINEWKGIEDIW